MELPTIFITGATDGIGLALARHYRHRATLLLLGRRPFAQTPLVAEFQADDYCRVDLSRPDCADVVADWLRRCRVDRIDTLLHNAATGYVGHTAEQTPVSIRDLTAVNLHAPITLTHRLLPLLPHPHGKIVFISSVVAALACPNYAVYGATKSALDGFARNLRLELRGRAQVLLISPGATRTGMHAKSGLTRQMNNWDNFAPADVVARQIAQAIERGRPATTIGWSNRLLRWGGRHVGGLFDAAMRKRAQ